ncbi:HNH endonuclease [Veronia nyctiphanis]|uniref:HNH endonuclease n=1 Tax=Veronia nyctiphanis TaxID=1278244 RepID=A0A4Q0YP09_9GAMM|nr:HNH endonuclease signature motif containing protein [Veronia nyctiphanis]RXJ71674.1 HNH endonuclease [Veronia nyctiphanis]
MKLTVDFFSLKEAVQKMGAKKAGKFELETTVSTIDPIDITLGGGLSVELKDVDIHSGLLSYKGRQVLLYIKDHGWKVLSAIDDPMTGNRFHVADCSKLKSMRAEGRFERYVVINDTSGNFPISGASHYGRGFEEGKARLKICKLCLKYLNYQGYEFGGIRKQIFEQFDMSQFFSTYSSFFTHMPSRSAETAKTAYSSDWTKVSSSYRVEKGFSCEQCGVNLRSHRTMLHVHHINGVKSDNSLSNLKALCIDCHSKQPMHRHMAVSHEQRQKVNQLRKEQHILGHLDDWQKVFDFSDPGVHGVLYIGKRSRLKIPDVNFNINDIHGNSVACLELAWPKEKFGVAISQRDRERATGLGWKVVSVNYFVENYKSIVSNLIR